VEQPRAPRAYLIFLAVALLQFGLLVLVAHTRVQRPAAVAIYALVLWRLARGGPIAWMLLLVVNFGLALLTTLGLAGNPTTGVLWGNVAIIAIPSLVMTYLLASTPMRRHVGLAHSPAAGW
jgi:hypothetical protein